MGKAEILRVSITLVNIPHVLEPTKASARIAEA
jgi:hypothetical protein